MAAFTPILESFHLAVSRREAVELLKAQIAEGVDLSRIHIAGVDAFAAARDQKARWNHRTCNALLRIDPSERATELFNRPIGDFLAEDADFKQFVRRFYEEVSERLRRLRAILARVQDPTLEAADDELAEEADRINRDALPSPVAATPPIDQPPNVEISSSEQTMSIESKTVRQATALVMHASDPTAEKSLTEFFTKLGYESVVLGNGSDGHAAGLPKQPTSFAVFLATPEEIAAAHDGQTTPAPVCRDMAFELGYFMGKLGEGRTCVVHTGSEAPFQDKYGIPYIPLDTLQGWQLQLARHLKRSGIELDLNRLC